MPKGIKICPDCSKHLAPRTKVCECGHSFEKIKPEVVKIAPVIQNKVTAAEDDEPHGKAGMSHILVPAGKCPYQFRTEEEIENWVEKVKAAGATKNQTYALEALEYWAGTFINKFSTEGKSLISKIKENI